ncbi:MAG: PLP-dependent aminotransferase family protein [Cutibacterium sp.]|nr:PLP-dependent aminotransferase family protein [Cutibacterium sp.]MDO4413209.1 PLP-dependent aminotransferase family protein [Cutibacterium sp.]
MLGDWSQPAQALPESLASALLDLIDAGFLPAGAILPSQRTCAATFQVSRQTVAEAFGILEAAGHIAALVGSGTRVRSGRAAVTTDGRLSSFSDTTSKMIDLSTGALPASSIARKVLAEAPVGMDEYFDTDGYFPAGLPVLREVIANRLTQDGLPTTPQQVMVTNGAQHACHLATQLLVSPGDTVLVEEPTYRGELEELRLAGARVETVPLTATTVDPDLLERGLARGPAMLHCQTTIHNPTGLTMSSDHRIALASLVDRYGVPVVEDCCSYDLTRSGIPAPMLARQASDDLVITLGTLSKLFWGGLRIGWLRASPTRVRQLVERRKADDLASPISTQLVAVSLMGYVEDARRERRELLRVGREVTCRTVSDLFPSWTWFRPQDGTGLWVDTHTDSQALAEAAKRLGIRLAPGPGYSAYDGQRTMLRLPVWHEPEEIVNALRMLQRVAVGR